MKRNTKIMGIIVFVVLLIMVLLCLIFTVDYVRSTKLFEKPIFAMVTDSYDDGGSATYSGIGYTAEIMGNFMPEDEFYGVTHVRFFLFGKEIKYVVRD